jgi:hypothetical protein
MGVAGLRELLAERMGVDAPGHWREVADKSDHLVFQRGHVQGLNNLIHEHRLRNDTFGRLCHDHHLKEREYSDEDKFRSVRELTFSFLEELMGLDIDELDKPRAEILSLASQELINRTGAVLDLVAISMEKAHEGTGAYLALPLGATQRQHGEELVSYLGAIEKIWPVVHERAVKVRESLEVAVAMQLPEISVEDFVSTPEWYMNDNSEKGDRIKDWIKFYSYYLDIIRVRQEMPERAEMALAALNAHFQNHTYMKNDPLPILKHILDYLKMDCKNQTDHESAA